MSRVESRFESLIEERFSLGDSKKVKQLAQKSSQGELSSAATLFAARTPTIDEVEAMEMLLARFSDQKSSLKKDAESLVSLSLSLSLSLWKLKRSITRRHFCMENELRELNLF